MNPLFLYYWLIPIKNKNKNKYKSLFCEFFKSVTSGILMRTVFEGLK